MLPSSVLTIKYKLLQLTAEHHININDSYIFGEAIDMILLLAKNTHNLTMHQVRYLPTSARYLPTQRKVRLN